MTHRFRPLTSTSELNAASAVVGEITACLWSADNSGTHFQSMDWQMRLHAEVALLLLDTACSGQIRSNPIKSFHFGSKSGFPDVRFQECPWFAHRDGSSCHVRSLVLRRGDRGIPRCQQRHHLRMDQQAEHAGSPYRSALEIQNRRGGRVGPFWRRGGHRGPGQRMRGRLSGRTCVFQVSTQSKEM